jgi:Signal transduction histidine kinase
MAPQAQPSGPSATYEETLPEAAPEARPRRLWLRSLTSRLVAGVVALVIVLVAAIGACTYVALRSFLDNRFDQQLTSTASQNVTYFDRCLQHPTPGPAGSLLCYVGPQTQREWVAAIDPGAAAVDPANAVYYFNSNFGDNLQALQLSNGQIKDLIANPNRQFDTQVGGVDLTAAAQQSRDGLIVVTGLSRHEVSRTLGRLIALELIVGAAAVVVAVAATSWGVRRSLRNLYRVTGTAQEVAAELSPEGAGLDRRVPVTEPGTEVGQLAESMNTLLAAVETQFAARLENEHRMRQFLADASHELRTPLTSIRGFAELARMQRAAGADTQHDNLDRIESEGTRMSRLVDDLLTLARGDTDPAAHAQPELIDVAELLDDAVAGSRAAHPGRPIDLEIAPLPAVLGDRDQLLRVVRNLITNAAVHTEPGRPILVRGCTEANGAVVTVADGGPGLPPEQAAHVFERFWRADKARSRARGGTGLGLSIVATIVRSHGGTVRFDSAVESGSTVTLWLPGAQE